MSSGPRPKSGLLLHGDRVGRYRILTHVADGGMAAVYLAELDGAMAFSKQVALKVIHRHLMSDGSFVQMFGDEARIAALLHHPNIVQTFDLVQTDEHVAIAMEYAPGIAASALSPQAAEPLGITVTPELVAYVGAEAAAGLHHAHTLTDNQGQSLGVVHRDISPANIHLGYDGRVRIVDFGIARARGRLSNTAQGLVKGTFAYVPPEQFAGAEPTPQSDVWSLGVVLWELLAGRKLFRRDTEEATAHAVMSAPIPAIETLRSDFTLALGVAVHRALERDPSKRWQSAKEMEERLREVLPAKIEVVRDPLLAALAPLRERHFAELRALLEVEEAEALAATSSEVVSLEDDSPPVERGPVSGASPEAGAIGEPRSATAEDPTPMSAADLSTLPRSPRRSRWIPAAALAGAVALVALGMATVGRDAEPGAPVRRGAGPAPEAATPAGELAPVARVSVEVTSRVPGARVSLDGRPLGPAPARALLPRDEGEHVVRVEADGRVAVEQRITLDAPVQLVLDPTSETPEAAAPAGGTAGQPPPPAPRRWRKTLTFDRNVYR